MVKLSFGGMIMTREEILSKVNEVFHEVFDDDSIVVTETTTAKTSRTGIH